MSALDKGPAYYRKNSIQPIEYILDHDLGFAEGCIVKYITRWKDKGGVDDLRKIKHYCEFLIERAVRDLPGVKRAALVPEESLRASELKLSLERAQAQAEMSEISGSPV